MKKICLVGLLYLSSILYASCPDQGRWFATGEFIYWKAHEDNLVFAIDGIGTLNSGSSKELRWKWQPGFKVGIGREFSCRALDLFLNYTWYDGRANGFAAAQNDDTRLFPAFAPEAVSEFGLATATSEWRLHYHTLDLEIGNWISLSSCFAFHPQIGIRGAFTRETDHINYIFTTNVQDLCNFKQHFNGVGPRAGLKTCWTFCNHLSLFGDGDFAFVWGEYHTSFRELIDGSVFFNTKHHFDVLRALLDIRLGLAWSIKWCVLQVAWEHRLWLKHNQFLRYNLGTPSTQRDNDGDLSLYGVNVCLKFCY